MQRHVAVITVLVVVAIVEERLMAGRVNRPPSKSPNSFRNSKNPGSGGINWQDEARVLLPDRKRANKSRTWSKRNSPLPPALRSSSPPTPKSSSPSSSSSSPSQPDISGLLSESQLIKHHPDSQSRDLPGSGKLPPPGGDRSPKSLTGNASRLNEQSLASNERRTGEPEHLGPSGATSGDREPEHPPRYSFEYQIKRLLFDKYDKTSRPVRNDSSTITVSIGMSLYHILDTNEKFQTLSSLVAVRLRWKDEYLTWNASRFGGVERVWIPAPQIWTPDIFISNFADDSFKDCMDTNAIVSQSGEVLWMFPAVVKTYCTLYVRNFPFDHQRCSLVFISWTFHGFKVNVTFNESENQAVYYTPRNQEWFVDRVTVVRNEKVYACCPEPYPDVTFTIHMTRRSLFYVINLIFPCLLIYAVSFLGFFLPIESGQKVNLEITILLALVVFLLIVGETLPPTPDSMPVLGILFGLTMIMVSISLVMSVIVTNIHLRKDTRQIVPEFVRRFIRHHPKRQPPNDVTQQNDKNDDVKTGSDSIKFNLNRFSLLGGDPDFSKAFRSGPRNGELTRPPSPRQLTHRLPGRDPRAGGGDPGDPLGPEELGGGGGEAVVSQSEEWVSLAKTLDRVFFWLFVAASASSLTVIFVSIPQTNELPPEA